MQQISFWKRYHFFSAQHKMGWKGTVLLGLALLGTLLTMGGTFVHAQIAPARILAVNTTTLHASTDCSYVVTQGWTCPLTLSRSDSSTASLPWSALSTSGILVTPTPATGTLLPGGTTTISIAVANRACPSTSTVSFKGPNNTVKVRWSCSAAPLTLTPTQFVANSLCPATSGGWQCHAVVGEAATSQGNLNWSTKSYLSGVTFTPANGVLSPGGSTPVSVFIPQGTKCASGNFRFAGQGSNTIDARWMCKPLPKVLLLNTTSLSQTDSACTKQGNNYACTINLSETSNSPTSANWTADTKLNGATMTPSSGTLAPGQSVSMSVVLPRKSGSVTFSSTDRQTVVKLTWNYIPTVSISEFELPYGYYNVNGFTKGSDGNLWFTNYRNYNMRFSTRRGFMEDFPPTGAIGRVDATGSISEFPLLSPYIFAYHLTMGPDGNLWFIEEWYDSTYKIGSITPTGSLTEFPLPTSYNNLNGLTAGPDGNLWFTENNSSIYKIGSITPRGSITEFPLPTSYNNLNGFITGSDGNLWFTENNGSISKIGRITPTGVVTEFLLPISGSHPTGFTKGPDGNLWFTEYGSNSIGRITPTGVVTEFPLPVGSSPRGITVEPNDNLWFTDSKGIGRITPTGVVTQFLITTPPYGSLSSITIGSDSNLWYTYDEGNVIGRIGRVTPTGSITEFPIAVPDSSPSDLTMGPDSNLWFIDEYGKGTSIGRVTLS